jgi:hypothetical protein
MPNSLPCNAVADECLRLIVESYQRLMGKALLGDGLLLPLQGGGNSFSLREALWNAPFAIVAHGTEADPIFFYGNRYALRYFEMSFDEFARLPSRLSAEPLAQEAREKLLDKVTRQGYIDNYSGMRIAKSGRRFMIANATVWNLVDERGYHHGQAAMFAVAE